MTLESKRLLNSVLWLGERNRPEFRAAWATLAARTTDIFEDERSPEGADDRKFDLVVFAQSRPGEFRASTLEAVHRAHPLAPKVVLVGAWSEGEERTGEPIGGAIRVPVASEAGFFEAQFVRLARGQSPLWDQPATATEADLALIRDFPSIEPGCVLISAENPEARRFLGDLFRRLDWEVANSDKLNAGDQAIDLAIWDARDLSEGSLQDLRSLRASVGEASILALAGFPRDADLARLRAVGATAVLTKPYHVDELLAQVARAVADCSSRRL